MIEILMSLALLAVILLLFVISAVLIDMHLDGLIAKRIKKRFGCDE